MKDVLPHWIQKARAGWFQHDWRNLAHYQGSEKVDFNDVDNNED